MKWAPMSTFCGRLSKKFQNIHHLEALFHTFRTPYVWKWYLLIMILQIWRKCNIFNHIKSNSQWWATANQTDPVVIFPLLPLVPELFRAGAATATATVTTRVPRWLCSEALLQATFYLCISVVYP